MLDGWEECLYAIILLLLQCGPSGLEVCYLHPHYVVNFLYISCQGFAIIYFILFLNTIIAHPSQ